MATEADVARSLLVVEDDAIFRRRLVRAFRERGFEVKEAGSLEEAARCTEAESPEYALVDLRLPDGMGLDVVKALTTLDPATKVVVLTGYGSIATALQAVRMGAKHYLTKPANVDEILAAFAGGDAEPLTPDGTKESTEVTKETTPTLARVEWEHIQRVLADCDGNVSEAARRLGLHRRSLQRKLSRYPPFR